MANQIFNTAFGLMYDDNPKPAPCDADGWLICVGDKLWHIEYAPGKGEVVGFDARGWPNVYDGDNETVNDRPEMFRHAPRQLDAGEMRVVEGQLWINNELRKWITAALAINTTYIRDAEQYVVAVSGFYTKLYRVPADVVRARDSDALRGIVEPEIVAYYSTRASDYNPPTITEHVVVLRTKIKNKLISSTDTLEGQAASLRAMATQRVHSMCAVADWDNEQRHADALADVVGMLGLVLRMERDFATVAELGPNFRRTPNDGMVVEAGYMGITWNTAQATVTLLEPSFESAYLRGRE
jgi:hypothetical protein